VTAPLRIAVIGDSLTFTDATSPQLPDHPDLWPNVMVRELERRTGREVALTVWPARPPTHSRPGWR